MLPTQDVTPVDHHSTGEMLNRQLQQRTGCLLPLHSPNQLYLKHLKVAELDSLRVTAADKAHNARDMVLDARRDPGSWERFNAGLDGTAWYLLRSHQTLSHRLPGSRSNEFLGESVQEILASEAYRRLVPVGMAPAVWAAGYLERPETHRSGSRAGSSTLIGP